MITRSEVLTELREIVATDPERVDPNVKRGGCLYFENQAPSCIVGHWLARHGVTWRDLARYDEERNSGVDELQLEIIGELTEEALELLSEVQMYQDSGKTWRVALDEALIDGGDEE